MERDDKAVHPKLAEMNDPYVKWRCPCIGMPCESIVFDSIEELVHHLQCEHNMQLIYDFEIHRFP